MNSETYWLPSGSFQPLRYHPGGIGNWSGHLPFAYDLVCAVEPDLLVELGTHYGESYFGFCQAVAENNIACSCYAVDTWVGECHAGTYDESVFNEVNAYNAALYSRFSYLLRTSFDEAAANFADESIDVLHIDGLHTYEAVSHDFRTWYPKVKPGGLVLLHDTSARHDDFGVWKFWNEVKSLGNCFSFSHSWGLGVHRKAGASKSGGGLLQALFESSNEYKEHIRNFYSLCALKLEHQHYYKTSTRVPAQAFPYGPDGYSAETAINSDAVSDSWQQLVFEVGDAMARGPLRFDPADRPGLIEIASMVLRNPASNERLWSADAAEISQLSTGGTLLRLKTDESPDCCRFLSFGPDPQLFLPKLDSADSERPALLEIRLRIHTDFSSLLPLLTTPAMPSGEPPQMASVDDHLLRNERDSLAQERDALIEERERLRFEDQGLLAERNLLLQERDSLLASFRKQQGELYVAKTDVKRKGAVEQELQARIAELNRTVDAKASELAGCRDKLAQLEQTLQGVVASRSWRITAPIRGVMELVRPTKTS